MISEQIHFSNNIIDYYFKFLVHDFKASLKLLKSLDEALFDFFWFNKLLETRVHSLLFWIRVSWLLF